MINLKSVFRILFLIGATVTAAFGGQAPSVSTPETDKWQYNLLNPTPRNLMREMSTDRPDKTESPYTVQWMQGTSKLRVISSVLA